MPNLRGFAAGSSFSWATWHDFPAEEPVDSRLDVSIVVASSRTEVGAWPAGRAGEPSQLENAEREGRPWGDRQRIRSRWDRCRNRSEEKGGLCSWIFS